MTLKYFAYGSNLHPVRLKERTPSCKFIAVAKLLEHRLCFHKKGADGSGKANAFYTGSPLDHVIGVIYEIDRNDKLKLDDIEGFGKGYRDKAINVDNNAGTEIVSAYVAEEGFIVNSLPPYAWYKELVLVGARFHQFPEYYVNQIVEVDPVPDPNGKRNEESRDLLKKMATPE